MSVPATQNQPLYQLAPLESPFGWKTENYTTEKYVQFDPSNLTLSFTVTRTSKIFAYFLSFLIGIPRIYNAYQEYKYLNKIHLHSFSNRSINWTTRGAIESIPILGGITCLIIDLFATFLNKSRSDEFKELEDPTDLSHKCTICNPKHA